jgi:hypothetical protein
MSHIKLFRHKTMRIWYKNKWYKNCWSHTTHRHQLCYLGFFSYTQCDVHTSLHSFSNLLQSIMSVFANAALLYDKICITVNTKWIYNLKNFDNLPKLKKTVNHIDVFYCYYSPLESDERPQFLEGENYSRKFDGTKRGIYKVNIKFVTGGWFFFCDCAGIASSTSPQNSQSWT